MVKINLKNVLDFLHRTKDIHRYMTHPATLDKMHSRILEFKDGKIVLYALYVRGKDKIGWQQLQPFANGCW